MLAAERAAIRALGIGHAHHLLDRAEPFFIRHDRAVRDLARITGIAVAIEIDRADRERLRLRWRDMPREQQAVQAEPRAALPSLSNFLSLVTAGSDFDATPATASA